MLKTARVGPEADRFPGPARALKGVHMPRIKVLNIAYENTSVPEAARAVLAFASSRGEQPAGARGGPKVVVTPNSEIAYSCMSDPVLDAAVQAADYAMPDGSGVVLASRILGTPLRGKVAGFDVACAMFPLMAQQGLSLYLYGAKPGIAEEAARRLRQRYPALRIAGTLHGYIRDDDAVAEAINRAQPDVVFVALGSPQQELWMQRNRGRLDAGVLMGLGGTLDILAGVSRRAPAFMVKLGLEWLYRLIREPWRFVRMLRLPAYLWCAVRARFGGKRMQKNNGGRHS